MEEKVLLAWCIKTRNVKIGVCVWWVGGQNSSMDIALQQSYTYILALCGFNIIDCPTEATNSEEQYKGQHGSGL